MGHDVTPDPSVIDGVLAAVLAEELVALTGQLSDLAYDLGSNPETLRAHMSSIQLVDVITQAQIAIADILRSDAPIEDRIASITLEALGQRIGDGYRKRLDVRN
ncbi:hypothetical protein [Sphingomonas jinjuensis]|nr:hypothetical protein [Sphingomonas jinjuensis]